VIHFNRPRLFVLSFRFTAVTHADTSYLTPSSRILLEKLVVLQLLKMFSRFYEIPGFIRRFTRIED
jgi:hypothetical protein